MNRSAILAVIALFSIAVVGQTQPGLYLDRGENNFSRVDHAPSAEIGSKGVVKSMFVPGVMPSGIWRFSGASAPLGTSIHPHFVYRLRAEQDLSARDFVMIQLDRRNDHREARSVRISAWSGNSTSGFDKGKLVPLRVTTEHDGFIEFEPIGNLVSGDEYFITANMSPRGYDFHADININETKASDFKPNFAPVENAAKPDLAVRPPSQPPDPTISNSPVGGSSEEVSLGEVARRARAHKTEPE